ncbi:hypothetical protein PFMC_05975 [Plasmodium falciparum CAMP/Malaysia]|uniref:Rifin n=1 Tax=Plasmodium falciparum (isolate Camp / Malaysia) TaxID=5835 RepID=A0A024WZ26_PLAFC|nr:hypothetical protein PFMC_05975 [Plasmodium falciparum CAMP/Malaysia]
MNKSLAEKLEKGCLRCGCGLGAVAASVGIFGTVAINIWKPGAITAAIEKALELKSAYISATANAAATAKVIELVNSKFGVSTLGVQRLETLFTAKNYTVVTNITEAVHKQFDSTCMTSGNVDPKSICTLAWQYSESGGNGGSVYNSIKTGVENIVSQAETVAERAVKTATEEVIQSSTAAVDAKYVICQNAIIASVVAILIIVLVMIIIYLVLRYRRKKKMNKKLQYTKLLNH